MKAKLKIEETRAGFRCRSCGRHVLEIHDYSSSESEDRTVEETSEA